MARCLAFPFRVSPTTGGLVTLEQGSPAEIGQSVGLLMDTRPGERRVVPGYGLPDPVFGGVSRVDVAAVIATWEPRANDALVDHVHTQLSRPYDDPPTATAVDQVDIHIPS